MAGMKNRSELIDEIYNRLHKNDVTDDCTTNIDVKGKLINTLQNNYDHCSSWLDNGTQIFKIYEKDKWIDGNITINFGDKDNKNPYKGRHVIAISTPYDGRYWVKLKDKNNKTKIVMAKGPKGNSQHNIVYAGPNDKWCLVHKEVRNTDTNL